MSVEPAGLIRPSDIYVGGRGGNRSDATFKIGVQVIAASVIVILAGLVVLLFIDARLALFRYGVGFVTTSVWDPVFEQFGILPYIYGTVVTSILALLIATPLGIGAALYIVEYAPPWFRDPVSFMVELLAAIPSIIYGLWGFFVLAPVMRANVEPFFKNVVGPLPVLGGLFNGPAVGKDLFTGGVILAIMILPTVMAISREVIRTVPNTQREGLLALGATKWEMISGAVLPYARSGIIGAAILGLGRALGETMAVTMVIGNSSRSITGSLLVPGYTMASAIANQFNEADKEIYFSAIVGVALLLLVVASVINALARLLVWQVSRGTAANVRAG
jgi:phosphate transport system permease protein